MSQLQKFILRYLLTAKLAKPRVFYSFYSKKKAIPLLTDQQTAIHRSLERLIELGLLVGYGRKTQQKWFLDQVRLTTSGRKKAKNLFQQQQLPFNNKRHGHTKKS